MERESIRTFGCDRIDEVDISKDSEFNQVNFDADEYFKYAIGITVIDERPPVDVCFTCTPLLANYLKTQPLHSSQTFIKEEKEIVVKLHVLITFELLQWLQGMSSEIVVLEPESLRLKFSEILKEASSKY